MNSYVIAVIIVCLILSFYCALWYFLDRSNKKPTITKSEYNKNKNEDSTSGVFIRYFLVGLIISIVGWFVFSVGILDIEFWSFHSFLIAGSLISAIIALVASFAKKYRKFRDALLIILMFTGIGCLFVSIYLFSENRKLEDQNRRLEVSIKDLEAKLENDSSTTNNTSTTSDKE